jgi:hypothetical protein
MKDFETSDFVLFIAILASAGIGYLVGNAFDYPVVGAVALGTMFLWYPPAHWVCRQLKRLFAWTFNGRIAEALFGWAEWWGIR